VTWLGDDDERRARKPNLFDLMHHLLLSFANDTLTLCPRPHMSTQNHPIQASLRGLALGPDFPSANAK